MNTFGVSKNVALIFAILVALTLTPVVSAFAQTAGTGSISGTVKDQNGLAVPGAKMVVRNVDTGSERNLTTNGEGLYVAPYLQPGHYEVAVSKEGFADYVHRNIELMVGQALTIDVPMQIKTAVYSVTVTSEPLLMDAERMDVSQTIAQYQVRNLPLNGRRWDNLVLLTPGVSEDGGFGLVSFRGISALYNNNMVDGADNNQAFFAEARGRTRLPYGYSLEAIQEFNVETSTYSAEYGRAAGGIVNAVTKSGTNQWHGDGFYFIRDSAFLARDPAGNSAGVPGNPKPQERRQQFGGTFGGPIVHDRLFVFGSYDQQKRNFPAIVLLDDPHFFETSTPGTQANVCVSDPNPAIVAECNTILTALHPIFLNLEPRKGDNYIGLGKVDFQINNNNRLSGVVNILRWSSPNGIQTQPTTTSSALANGADNVNDEFLTITLNSVITPSVVNEFRFQYGRDFEFQSANHSGPAFPFGDNGGADFGMPDFLPRGAFPNEKRNQWLDNLTWSRGRHQFKVGFDINHVSDKIQNLFLGGGNYDYSGCGSGALLALATDIVTASSSSCSGFTQAGDPITGSGKGSFSTNDFNFYFQDNIKLRPDFTLNLGLRYEVQTMPSVVRANPLVPETSHLNTDWNNLGPRLGFAWNIHGGGKQVLRGGYGIYYGRTQNSTIFSFLFQNGNFQQTFSLSPGDCGYPLVPNDVLPQPSTAPPFSPIFGTTGPTPVAEFPSVSAFLAKCPGSAAATTVDTLARNFVNPLVHEFDLAYERELPGKLDFTLSYLGSRANHLPVFDDANLPPPDTTKTYVIQDINKNVVGTFTVPFFSGAVPRPNPNVGIVLEGRSAVNSWYHGMVVSVRRREVKGFSFDSNFTWSQARDDGQVAGVNGTFSGTVIPLNPFNLRGEYGLSELDIRRRFLLNLYWVTPFADWTQNDVLKHVVGGWRFSSVFRAQDGHPITAGVSGFPRCAFDGALTCGAVSSFGSRTSGRAPFFPRNSHFNTPGFWNFDLRVDREFKLTERASLDLIWEAFNLFNHTLKLGVNTTAFNFNNPGSRGCPAAGSPGVPAGFKGCVLPNRSFQLVRSTSNTLYGARQMQLGIRIRF
jgi:hypothetical protein